MNQTLLETMQCRDNIVHNIIFVEGEEIAGTVCIDKHVH